MIRARSVLICSASAALLCAVGCSQEGVESPGNVAGTAGIGTSGSGTPLGGAPTGGQATGGSAPNAGAMTGGTGGTPAPVAGAGGSGGASGASGSGNVSGAAGTGGTGTSGSGGAAGGSAGSGGAAPTPMSIVPSLDGYLWVGNCTEAVANSLDCAIRDDNGACPNTTAAWPMRGAFKRARHTVGGTMGTKYTLNFEVRGVVGGKFYRGGMAASTMYSDTDANNTWYAGGTPTESLWNTYEIHVTPPVPGAPNVYYANAFPEASAFDGKHQTFWVRYSASFPVLGGGTIELVIHDSNCNGQQNCGVTVPNQRECTSPRTIPLDGLDPQPMPPFSQPYRQSNNTHPQWLFIDVKSVSVGP